MATSVGARPLGVNVCAVAIVGLEVQKIAPAMTVRLQPQASSQHSKTGPFRKVRAWHSHSKLWEERLHRGLTARL